jgi:hypothetical protein
MMDKILIGTGILNWPRFERISDRYGSINLNEPGDVTIELSSVTGYGQLVAEVKEIRQSRHVGDFCRELSPTTPTLGEILILGEGRVFFDDYNTVGLKPADGRNSDWLNPKVLYRLHEQTVDLYFVKTEE